MYLIAFAVLCLKAISTTPINSHNIHKRMSPEEVHQVFGTTHTDVPEYKVVNIRVSRIQKRDTSSKGALRIHSDDGEMDIVLSPTEGFLVSESTPVTFVTYSNISREFEFRDVPNAMKNVGDMMEDPVTSSFFVIMRDRERRDVVNGYIGSRNLVVRSLPKRLHGSLFSNNTNSHVAFKFKTSTLRRIVRDIRDTDPTSVRSRRRRLRVVPDAIYPQFLVVVDSTSFLLHGRHLDSLLIYHSILWHAVNVRFRTLRKPEVNLNIARFVISREISGTPYIESAYYDAHRILHRRAIDSGKEFWYRVRSKIPVPSYDGVVIFTAKGLLGSEPQPGEETTQITRGAAMTASMCRVYDVLKIFEAVAIVQDRHDLDSYVLAHELGHLLGIRHDSTDERSPCVGGHTYAMAPSVPFIVKPEDRLNYWEFSNCSGMELYDDLNTYDRSCLYNKPETKRKILPEIVWHKYLVTADKCKLQYGKETTTCENGNFPKEDECVNVYCYVEGDDCFKSSMVPEDGRPCDDGNKYCQKGVCVSA